MHSSIRARQAAGAALLVALASGATAATAQAPQAAVPQLRLGVVPGKAPSVGLAAVQPGPTEVVITSPSKAPRPLLLVRLNGTTTPAQFKAASDRRLDERAIDRLGKVTSTFVVQGAASKSAAYRATVDLKPGTYVVADINGETRTPQRSFSVGGAPNLAALPATGGTIDMVDFAFKTDEAVLPASGNLLIRNAGKQMHFTLAFPTSSASNATKLATILRKGGPDAEKASEKLIAGPPTEPVGLISPGEENRVPVKFRPGNYVLVCFYGSPASKGKEHNQLGMVRKVRFG